MEKTTNSIFRRDFLKGLATIPFLGYFAFGFRKNLVKEAEIKIKDNLKTIGIDKLAAPQVKLNPSNKDSSKRVRFGVVGNGWRGEQLLRSFGYVHPEQITKNTINGKYSPWLQDFLKEEDINVEFAGVCDTFSILAQRGLEISTNDIRPGGGQGKTKPAKIFPTYREMIESKDIDAIVIATPDHWHTRIACDAARMGKHVFLEKPMTHTIEEAIELRDTIKSTGVVFQLGHENRQQMSFKIAKELVQKGVLGTISMVQTYTNRNGLDGAWIRKRKYYDQGTPETINWKEFLGKAPMVDFDPKRYFNWQRYSDYGTGATGNNFSHQFDCVNQVLDMGIPESVVALGGQYYYKDHGDMPDVLSVVFNYPKKGYVLTYDCTLKNGIYRENYIMGSDAAMIVDLGIKIYKDDYSEKYKNIDQDSSTPIYIYNPNTGVDAVSSATSRAYFKGGYGSTFIDGKVLDATFLHLKEWVDAIRDQGKTSCNIDVGFEEAVTYNLANLSYMNSKRVTWDSVNEKAILS